MIRVLIADDHAAVRAGVRAMLNGHPDITAVGDAADGPEAVRLTQALAPDVLLLDLQLPGMTGVDVCRTVVRCSSAKVLVLTAFGLDENVGDALRAGAAGFLLKTTDAPDLARAIRSVAAGDSVLSPEVTGRVIASFVDATADRVPHTRSGPHEDGLTGREREVLDLLERGYSNRQIAEALVISPATAKTHVSRVLQKLGVASRLQAAVWRRTRLDSSRGDR